jgi:hypothetical protein
MRFFNEEKGHIRMSLIDGYAVVEHKEQIKQGGEYRTVFKGIYQEIKQEIQEYILNQNYKLIQMS